MAATGVEVTQGPGGQPLIILHGPCGSKVELHQFGAHVTSWMPSSGREMLYMSPTAVLDGSKAIRGGIPVCFPQFGKHGNLKQHGFARNTMWALVEPNEDTQHNGTSASSSVQLVLTHTNETLQSAWPYKFKAVMTVEIQEDGSLFQQLEVHNLDQAPFEFSTALHAYFLVPDSEQTTVPGLTGLTYADNTADGKEKEDTDEVLHFGREVDRLYYSSADILTIPSASLRVLKKNLPDVVIWNPYIHKAAALADMPDDDWKRFICIEPARVQEKAVVHPGESWSASILLMALSKQTHT